MSSFAAQVISSRTQNIYLITGGRDHTDREAWYYLQVEPTKTALLERGVQTGKLNLSDLGLILESGYGARPPETIRKKMQEKYGFEEEIAET